MENRSAYYRQVNDMATTVTREVLHCETARDEMDRIAAALAEMIEVPTVHVACPRDSHALKQLHFPRS